MVVRMQPARVVKLVDTRDLKSLGSESGRAGSSPALGTRSRKSARERFRNRNAATGRRQCGVIQGSVHLTPTRETETRKADAEQRQRRGFGCCSYRWA